MENENKIIFDCIEMIQSLSKTRSNKKISSDFGISYSQVNTWASAAETPESSNVSLDYYIYFFLEYFKRINIDESSKLMKKHGLVADVDEIFLENEIFPENMTDAYMSSSIEWKNELVLFLYTQNSHVLRAQIKIIDKYLDCLYSTTMKKTKMSSSRIGEILRFKMPSHL